MITQRFLLGNSTIPPAAAGAVTVGKIDDELVAGGYWVESGEANGRGKGALVGDFDDGG